MCRVIRLVIALLAFAMMPSQAVLIQDVGEGSDVSYLYIQFSNTGAQDVLYRYHYDYSSSSAMTGAEMIYNISSIVTSKLSLIDNGGSVSYEGFYFLFGIYYDGVGDYGDFASSEYWNYFVAGGEVVAYDPDTFSPIWGSGGVGDYTFNSVASGDWAYSPVGLSDRVVMPGSWDGFTFGGFPAPTPDMAPVPEPSSVALLGGGLLMVIGIRRRFVRSVA